jgi:RHS repeat-associated protein
MQKLANQTERIDKSNCLKRKVFNLNFTKVFSNCLLIPLLFVCVFGQSPQHTENKVDQTLQSSGRVNPSTLGMEIDIPLGSYGGRGINVPVSLKYSSKLWRMEFMYLETAGIIDGGCRAVHTAKYSENSASGWTSSLAVPYIEYLGMDNIYDGNGNPWVVSCESDAPSPGSKGYVRRLMIHLPGGETHELRADDTVTLFSEWSRCPPPYGYTCDPRDGSNLENWSGTYYATDGSNIKYVEDANTGSYRLLMPDGSYYDFSSTPGGVPNITSRKAIKFTDRNGNFSSYNNQTGVLTDTLGRNLSSPVGTSAPSAPTPANEPISYSMPGMTGTYKFHWKYLKGSTAAESGLGLTNFNQALRYKGDSVHIICCLGNWEPIPPGTASLFQSSQSPGGIVLAEQIFNPIVLTKIELPTGQSYKFEYDVYGRIEGIYYPTGGEERFTYNAVAPLAQSEPGNVTDQTNFGVTNRKVYQTSGQGTPYEWNYSINYVAPSGYKVKTISPDQTIYERVLHRANGACTNCTAFGFDNGLAGMPYEELNFSNTGQLVSRKLTSWITTKFPVYISLYSAVGYNFGTFADWHPRVNYEQTINYDSSGNGVSASTKFEYEGDINLRETPVLVNKATQYAFVPIPASNNLASEMPDPDDPPDPIPTPIPTPSPSSLIPVKIVESTYLINDTVNYPVQSVRDAYKNQNMVGLVTVTKVKDGANTIVSQSETKYDESGYSPAYRGNPTTLRVWDSTKGAETNASAYISTRAKFDAYGNQIEAIDAKGTVTTTEYSATYNYAFPTKVTTAIPDPTPWQNPGGVAHGSGATFFTTTTYDYNISTQQGSGLPLTTTNANGLETRIEYDPVTLRVKKVKNYYANQQVGGEAEKIYNDQPNNYWVKSKTQIDTNKWAESTTYYDGLGRAYKSEQLDAQGNIFVEKEFDEDGRVKRVTNPFRANETKIWTTNVYDEASRIMEVVLPDGAKVKTNYGVAVAGAVGVTKQITDQAGKKRKGVTDALGRMIRVTEDPDGQNLSTDYVFDTLGNLRKTVQGEQNRYFMYDSLGRLLYAKQREQQTNAAFVATDPITSNSQWSVKYEYDDNGNISKTTDARGVYVQGTYDKFNRLIFRDYSDSTPDVHFYYDGTGLGAVPDNSKGKTTKVASSVSETRYTSFDNFGRLLTNQQYTDGQAYDFSYQYNLVGALVQETYPLNRVVKYEYDADGALSRVFGNAAGQTEKTYANSFNYSAAGAIESMKLGNGKWETAKYNDRLQVTEIGLGNSEADASLLKLSFDYGTSTENNGSMKSQTMVVPTTGANAGFTAVQNYIYDSLNRLKSATEITNNNPTPSWKQTFDYDRYGNRRFDANDTTTLGTCLQAICNPLINTSDNRLSDGQGYSYDANGNLTQDANGQRFGYDAENHQVAFFKNTNGTQTPDATYFYDGEGRRVKKIADQTTTIFVYNGGGQLAQEYSTKLSTTPQTSYLTGDHLGSPRVITNQLGSVTARKDYSAFGEETFTSHRTSGLGYDPNDYKQQPEEARQGYTGYQKDEESGLEFAQARYYNSAHGRFTSVDPLTASASIRDPQTFNRYSYALNSPYKFTDPLGLRAKDGTLPEPSLFDKVKYGLELTKNDIMLLQWHVANGTALGYSYQNAMQSRMNQQSNETTEPPQQSRTVALAALVSKNPSEENAFLARAKKATKEVAQFSGGADLIGSLMEFSESGSIDEIIIHDHGFAGGIIGNAPNVGLYVMEYANSIKEYNFPGAETTENFAWKVKSGQINIGKNGSIVIFGCNCSNFAQELSSKLGGIAGRSDITVTGANNAVYEKNGAAFVDRRTDGISKGSKGSFITYRNGIEISTVTTRNYK